MEITQEITRDGGWRDMAAAALNRYTRRDRPQFFFWNREEWYEQRELQRREAVGTPSQRTRRWTVNTLRSPRAILQKQQLCDIHGDVQMNELRGKVLRNGGATKRARENAHHGDADLYRGQKLVWRLRHLKRASGTPIAAFRHARKPRLPGRDQGHFSHRQDAVAGEKQENDGDFKQYLHSSSLAYSSPFGASRLNSSFHDSVALPY